MTSRRSCGFSSRRWPSTAAGPPRAARALVERVREDRATSRRGAGHPAGLAEDLARRQLGLVALCRIGELAMQGLAPRPFLEQVLGDARQSLRADAAVILMRDGGGFVSHSAGDAALVRWLLDRKELTHEPPLGAEDRQ